MEFNTLILLVLGALLVYLALTGRLNNVGPAIKVLMQPATAAA